MEALAQAHMSPQSNNEYLGIVDNEPESGDVVLDIDMEMFSSVIQSNLDNCPLYYSGYSYRTNQHRRCKISKSKKIMGKGLFYAWSIPYPDYTQEETNVHVTMRKYKNMDLSPNAFPEALELITDI